MALAGQYKSDLKCLISKEPGPEGSRMERLLSSILNFLLKKNGFDADSLKKKFRAVARFIEEKKRGRNCNILGGINSLHGESSEVVGPSSPPSFTERLNLDRPRHLSSSSATNFSPQSLTCLSTSPNTIIIPTNLPPPLISSCSPLTGPGTLTSPPTGIPGGGTGTVLTFTPTPLLSKSTKGANNTSSLSSSSASSSISSTSSSASSSLTSAAAAAAACSSILSLTGTEYSVSSVTAIPQPTIFSSSLFCPTYPYSPLVTTGGPLQSPYQTINCPTGIIRSPSSSVSPGKSSFSPHHQPVSARNSPNSCANFNRTNHNVSIHLADTLHKSTNHHNHQHATSLYSFLGSNSGAINLSKRLN
ncbi:uncharacterized protein LOC128397821 [Panonychus citri]|uniref:uncharacterized protein LOC128397821 n=1 Tax=Panonychus citri TaxID=50023 RepID=UPI002306DFB3|nr:uncharacterized protein LOC128397821 [Panonychus citri]